ncbi:CoA transferase [Pelagibius litoralis]|uniref:CoA transferase n=1 Tax=Pelagibius litoralis TaxID=374515 RepID=A0A967EVC6_9PROT|nr:CoA transferase [Pelagibius litoralis]NIA67654.1 CoA transferase [Pelagibius litoralis]
MTAAFTTTAPQPPEQVLREILELGGLDGSRAEAVTLTGQDPVLPSSFAVGSVAQTTIAATAVAAAELWRLRGGRPQDIAVDMGHAAIEFRSERYLTVDGQPPKNPWDPLAGAYRTGDGRWVRLHTNFAHHRDGILALLDCANDREAVQHALNSWKAADFETAVAERGLVATMMRSPEEWLDTPQGQALARQPLVSFERIAGSPTEAPPPAERPLAGLRVMDLTRIIAGPIAGRALAAHGAEVMRITGPHLPFIEASVIDCGRGKLSTHVDLRSEEGRRDLTALLRKADVFVQGYRPGAFADRGFGPTEAAAIRPGIIYVSLSAYGFEGPWAGRRGFDSLVQTASGINHAEAEAAGTESPKALPCQALDHGAGYLMAFGAIAGLRKRALEGGSWHIRVSLARCGRWLQSLGRVAGGHDCPEPDETAVAELLEQSESGFGSLSAVRHSARMSETAPAFDRPSAPLGSHPACWPD